MAEILEGWTWVSNSTTWHYFGKDRRSLCGRVAFSPRMSGELQADLGKQEPHPEDCVACFRKLQARRGDCPGRSEGRYGFASMDPEKQREIARMGGKAAHEMGVAHEWTSEEAREAGRKGGAAVVLKYGYLYMSDIGRIGGSR